MNWGLIICKYNEGFKEIMFITTLFFIKFREFLGNKNVPLASCDGLSINKKEKN